MVYNTKDCLIPNAKSYWKELFYLCEIEKYKPTHLISLNTSLINIPAEEDS